MLAYIRIYIVNAFLNEWMENDKAVVKCTMGQMIELLCNRDEMREILTKKLEEIDSALRSWGKYVLEIFAFEKDTKHDLKTTVELIKKGEKVKSSLKFIGQCTVAVDYEKNRIDVRYDTPNPIAEIVANALGE